MVSGDAGLVRRLGGGADGAPPDPPPVNLEDLRVNPIPLATVNPIPMPLPLPGLPSDSKTGKRRMPLPHEPEPLPYSNPAPLLINPAPPRIEDEQE